MKDDYAVNRSVVDLSPTLMAKEIKSSDASANENLYFGCVFNKDWIWSQWEAGFV